MSAYVPIDLHRHRSVVMNMTADGEVLGWVRLANDPEALVAEVLKDLAHAGLVVSHRGALGGYSLAMPPERITLGKIIATIEGAPAITNCDSLAHSRDGGCEVHPVCPIRSPIEQIREHIWKLFEATSLRSLVPVSGARRSEVIIQRLRESLASTATL